MSKHRNCTGNSSDKKPKCSDTPQTNVPTPRPVIIPTKGLVAGFAAERIPKGGAGWIEICGFHTFDEGLSFYKMLDGFTTHAHALGLMPSVLDRMLVMIAPDYTYIYANNSLPLLGKMRVKEGCKKGGIIGSDNLVDIAQLEFCGISPPEKSGFMLLVSAGWRRGMCFDFRPLQPDTQISTQASFEFIKRLGAIVLTHLWFTDKFLLTADDWDKVIESGWFPFMLLPVALWEKLLDGIRHNEHLDEQEEAIHKFFLEVVDRRLVYWAANDHLNDHIPFLKDAAEAYKNGRWAACVASALPRVEGMLRQAFGVLSGGNKEVLNALEKELAEREHSRSLLFPKRLRDYFDAILYPYTEFSKSDLPATRHTVAHGLVKYDQLGRRQALTTLLLIDHIIYCMPLSEDPVSANAPNEDE